MKDLVEQHYNNFVENNIITHDKKQVELLKTINKVWQQSKKIYFFAIPLI